MDNQNNELENLAISYIKLEKDISKKEKSISDNEVLLSTKIRTETNKGIVDSTDANECFKLHLKIKIEKEELEVMKLNFSLQEDEIISYFKCMGGSVKEIQFNIQNNSRFKFVWGDKLSYKYTS